jgi:hypothetical protein
MPNFSSYPDTLTLAPDSEDNQPNHGTAAVEAGPYEGDCHDEDRRSADRRGGDRRGGDRRGATVAVATVVVATVAVQKIRASGLVLSVVRVNAA